MAERTPERTQSHAFAVLRASSKRLLMSIAGFQDGKSAAEILIRSACSDQSRRDCNSQNFRLAVSVASPSSAASISIELWQTSRSRPLSPSTSFMKQTIRWHLDDLQRASLHQVEAGGWAASGLWFLDDVAERGGRADPSQGDA